MHSTKVILFQLFLSEFCPFSACDNIRSPDNFRLIMLRDRSYSYMCEKMSGQNRDAVAFETNDVHRRSAG